MGPMPLAMGRPLLLPFVFVLLLGSLCLLPAARAQTVVGGGVGALNPYAVKLTGANKAEDAARALAVDAAGSAWTAGHFKSATLTVGDATLTNNGGGSGTADVFVTKHTPAGVLEWALAWGGDKDDVVVDITLEPDGANAYVVGLFKSERMTFGPNSGGRLVNELYDAKLLPFNVFIAKVSATGQVVWKVQTGDGSIAGVGVDMSRKRIYVTGTFPSFLANFDDDDAVTVNDEWDAWASEDFGTDDDDPGMDPFAEGGKSETAWWDDDPLKDKAGSGLFKGNAPPSGSTSEVYLDYYSMTTGDLMDGTVFTGDGDDWSTDLIMDPSNRSPIVVGFSQSKAFRVAKTLVVANDKDAQPAGSSFAWIAKFDAATSSILWARGLGLALSTRPIRVVVDASKTSSTSNLLYISGTFASEEMQGIMRGSVGGTPNSLPALIRMDADTGKIDWVRGLPPAFALGVDYMGGLFVVGVFQASVSFALELPTLTANSVNGDLYMAKLMPTATTANVVQATRYGGGSTSRFMVTDVETDAPGNVYWCGNYSGGTLGWSKTFTALPNPGTGNSDGFMGRLLPAALPPTPSPTTLAPSKSPSWTEQPSPLPTEDPDALAFAALANPEGLPTPMPTAIPPTPKPTPGPPTPIPPSPEPTRRPSRVPTDPPTTRPTKVPTAKPTKRPSPAPTTRAPTNPPTPRPTPSPTLAATPRPSRGASTPLPTFPPNSGTSGLLDAVATGNSPSGSGSSGSDASTAAGTGGTAGTLTTGTASATSIDMVMSYAGPQSSILAFERSFFELVKPYTSSFASFIPSSPSSRRQRRALEEQQEEAARQPISAKQRKRRLHESMRHLSLTNRCTSPGYAKFSLPFYIETKNRAATSKILGLLTDLLAGVVVLDNGNSIFDKTVLCDVSYSSLSASPLAEAKATAMDAVKVVPAVTTEEAPGALAGETGSGNPGKYVGIGFVAGAGVLLLAAAVFFLYQRHHAKTQAAAARQTTEKYLSDFVETGRSPNTANSPFSSPDEARKERERWHQTYLEEAAAEREKAAKDHAAALSAAVSAAVMAEQNRLRQEHKTALAAAQTRAGMGEAASLAEERQRWEQEQEAVISTVVAAEREKWFQEQSSRLASMASSGGGGRAGAAANLAALTEAVNAERARLTQEHAAVLAAAQERWQQAQALAVVTAVAAEKERWDQGYVEDVTVALQEERTKWEAEQVNVLAEQKKALKLRYAAALTAEMEKWESEHKAMVASLRAHEQGDHAGAVAAAVQAEREKLMHEQAKATEAALAAERERQHQEQEAALFAQKNMLKQRYAAALGVERERWQKEAEAALQRERATWETEHVESLRLHQSILDPNHPAGLGDALAAQQEKWANEHAAALAAALAAERERSKAENATILQASLAAQRKKLQQDHALAMAAALAGALGTEQTRMHETHSTTLAEARAQWEEELAAERAHMQQEHEAALATQKSELKMRYATVLAQEREKWKAGAAPGGIPLSPPPPSTSAPRSPTPSSPTPGGATASSSSAAASPISSPSPPKYAFTKRGSGGGGGGNINSSKKP